MHVASQVVLDARERVIYQDAAARISKLLIVPAERFRYYSAYNSDRYGITGWYGSVVAVKPVEGGGRLVTVMVCPSLRNFTCTGRSDYAEQYLIDSSDRVHNRGFLDPNGWSGLDMGALCL